MCRGRPMCLPSACPDGDRSGTGPPQGAAPTSSLMDLGHRFKTMTTKRYATHVGAGLCACPFALPSIHKRSPDQDTRGEAYLRPGPKRRANTQVRPYAWFGPAAVGDRTAKEAGRACRSGRFQTEPGNENQHIFRGKLFWPPPETKQIQVLIHIAIGSTRGFPERPPSDNLGRKSGCDPRVRKSA